VEFGGFGLRPYNRVGSALTELARHEFYQRDEQSQREWVRQIHSSWATAEMTPEVREMSSVINKSINRDAVDEEYESVSGLDYDPEYRFNRRRNRFEKVPSTIYTYRKLSVVKDRYALDGLRLPRPKADDLAETLNAKVLSDVQYFLNDNFSKLQIKKRSFFNIQRRVLVTLGHLLKYDLGITDFAGYSVSNREARLAAAKYQNIKVLSHKRYNPPQLKEMYIPFMRALQYNYLLEEDAITILDILSEDKYDKLESNFLYRNMQNLQPAFERLERRRKLVERMTREQENLRVKMAKVVTAKTAFAPIHEVEDLEEEVQRSRERLKEFVTDYDKYHLEEDLALNDSNRYPSVGSYYTKDHVLVHDLGIQGQPGVQRDNGLWETDNLKEVYNPERFFDPSKTADELDRLQRIREMVDELNRMRSTYADVMLKKSKTKRNALHFRSRVARVPRSPSGRPKGALADDTRSNENTEKEDVVVNTALQETSNQKEVSQATNYEPNWVRLSESPQSDVPRQTRDVGSNTNAEPKTVSSPEGVNTTDEHPYLLKFDPWYDYFKMLDLSQQSLILMGLHAIEYTIVAMKYPQTTKDSPELIRQLASYRLLGGKDWDKFNME
jgi:hypothetical protein